MTYILLAVIVLIGFTTEATIGFGATLISLTLAANIISVNDFLPIFVPVNYGLFLYVTITHRKHIRWDIVTRRIMPAMGLGVPIGLAMFNFADPNILKTIYSLFVIGLSAVVLVRLVRNPDVPDRPLPMIIRYPLLFFAGIMHGMYSLGGPIVVYNLARENVNKMAFRATACFIWLVLGTVLLINFAATGLLTRDSLIKGAGLAVPLMVAIFLGEWLSGRVNEHLFRMAVFIVLLLAGVVLLINPA